MTSDVVLSAALRANLLSLQNTQSSIDITQNRLATGKKVNSALDSPQAFFASQALTNRANDLNRLLDSIGQSIQVIKAADNGVTALTKLVEQADSIAQSARDALAGSQAEAKVVGDRDLRNIDDLTSLAGISNGDDLIFSLTDEDGTTVNIGSYNTGAGTALATATIDIATFESTDDLIAEINSLSLEATSGSGIANGEQAFEASLDDAGNLQIRTLNGGDFRLQFVAAVTSDAADLATAADLGFANIARLSPGGGAAGNNNVEFTAIADVALNSFALVSDALGTVAQRSSLLSSLRNAETPGVNLFAGIDAVTDDYQIGFNGGALTNIELALAAAPANSVTIQDFIDDINSNTTLNTKIVAEFDDVTGVLSLRTIDASVESIEVGVAASVVTANWGFGRNGAVPGTATNSAQESIRIASAAGDLLQFEEDYNNLRAQIDQLVTDTGYRGTNLLNGDVLTTFFNEDRSNSLITEGSTFTSAGLGLEAANFARADTIDGALDEVRAALETVRNFGSALANDLTVIQTRETFTKALINTLNEGSDKLVNADQNEEGAKLLALQTRQSLGITSLSLASQSQQSILRLF